MIRGIGVDVVDIARFEATLVRAPRLRERLFTPAEAILPPRSLAARFAAKEALAKALRAPSGLSWHDAEVVRPPGAQPVFSVTGSVQKACRLQGITRIHLSLTHDGGIATAMVVAESDETMPEAPQI